MTRPTHDRVDLDEQKETSHKSTLRKTFRTTIVASALAAAALVPAAQAQDEEFIPRYTDFPNALRVGSSGTFVPGHSDEPPPRRQQVRPGTRQRGRPEERVVLVPAAAASAWTDAGIGAAARPVSSSSRPAAPCWRSAGPPGAALTG